MMRRVTDCFAVLFANNSKFDSNTEAISWLRTFIEGISISFPQYITYCADTSVFVLVYDEEADARIAFKELSHYAWGQLHMPHASELVLYKLSKYYPDSGAFVIDMSYPVTTKGGHEV